MRRISSAKALVFALLCNLAYASPGLAQAPASRSAISTEIAPGVHLLPGLSSNVLAVIGPLGTLLVDSGAAGDAERLPLLLEQVDAGSARIVVNTHFHFDHIGGNQKLGENGAVILAHARLRPRLQEEWALPESVGLSYPSFPPYPEAALPNVLVENSSTIYFGGQEVSLIHFPSAHTDADLVVFLPEVNVLHTGDLFAAGGFVPPLDSFHGGTINGWISAVDEMIALTDSSTKVVPGHGPVADRQALREFRNVLVTGRDRIAALIEEGKTLDEAVAAAPMTDLIDRGGEAFVRTVYPELSGWEGSGQFIRLETQE